MKRNLPTKHKKLFISHSSGGKLLKLFNKVLPKEIDINNPLVVIKKTDKETFFNKPVKKFTPKQKEQLFPFLYLYEGFKAKTTGNKMNYSTNNQQYFDNIITDKNKSLTENIKNLKYIEEFKKDLENSNLIMEDYLPGGNYNPMLDESVFKIKLLDPATKFGRVVKALTTPTEKLLTNSFGYQPKKLSLLDKAKVKGSVALNSPDQDYVKRRVFRDSHFQDVKLKKEKDNPLENKSNILEEFYEQFPEFKKIELPENMSEEQAAALLSEYTQGATEALNRRTKPTIFSKTDIDKDRENLIKLITANKLPNNNILKRNTNDFVTDSGKNFKDLQVGDKFTDKGFVSTTYGDRIKSFGNYELDIQVPEGKKLSGIPVNVNPRNEFKFEKEVLLPPNLEFEIVDITPEGKRILKILNPYMAAGAVGTAGLYGATLGEKTAYKKGGKSTYLKYRINN